MAPVLDVRTKRVYEEPAPGDGFRMLVDRVWPRGVSRERARLDEWDRTLSPSTELRKWFGHDPGRYEEFRRRYLEELQGHRDRLSELRSLARQGTLTLVYGAKDPEHNQAIVLAEVLRNGLPRNPAWSREDHDKGRA
ncbi:MAG TPA: DUF488 family protein [Solirubrobacterales bacterium]|nr:DUF488 family protein [Solirubrobacterales bacterium]